MKKNRIAMVGLSLVLLVGLILAACAAPAPAPTPAPAPKPAPTPVAPPQTPLQKIIEAAKKEPGPVNLFIHSETDCSLLAKAIKDKYGVDLKLNCANPGSSSSALAKIALEVKAGQVPSNDYIFASAWAYLTTVKTEGLAEDIDWNSLITDPEERKFLIPPPANFLGTWGYVQLLAYRPDLISEKDLPKSYSDLTNPKYQGKFGFPKFSVPEVIHGLGFNSEKGLQWFKSVVANKPMIMNYSDLANKLMLGEIQFTVATTPEMKTITMKDPNAPIKWKNFDEMSYVVEYTEFVIKGAKNKNSAALTILFRVSKEGRELWKKFGYDTYLDKGSLDAQLVEQAKAKGIPIVNYARDAKLLEWLASQESVKLASDVDLIIKGK